MIATQSPSPSWTEQGERLRAAVTQAADVVAGPLPRRLGTPSPQPRLAAGRLAVRAALWGVALGLLAPATTLLVQVSGLAADGVRLAGATDLGFFFGFVPLLAALVVTLLALDHWPLRDLRAYHRELAVGLLLVGAVTLVGLRAHGAAVTGDEWDDAWLFANGSLVLHVLATWFLVRLATDDLTALHARHAGWRPARTTTAAGIPSALPGTTRTAPTGGGSGPGRAPAVAAGARPLPGDWWEPDPGAAGAATRREAAGGGSAAMGTAAREITDRPSADPVGSGHPPGTWTAARHGTGTAPDPDPVTPGHDPAGPAASWPGADRYGSDPATPGHHAAGPAASWPGADRYGSDPAAPGQRSTRAAGGVATARLGAPPHIAAAGPAMLAWEAPRHLATLALALRSVVWGVIVGIAAGAAAGTAVRPGLGTLAGGYLGAIYGLVPTAVGTAALVTVVSWRRDTDPAAAERAVQATLAGVGAGVLAAAWPFLHGADLPGAAAVAVDPPQAWLLGAVVVVLLLRRAAAQLATTYLRLVPPAGRS